MHRPKTAILLAVVTLSFEATIEKSFFKGAAMTCVKAKTSIVMKNTKKEDT